MWAVSDGARDPPETCQEPFTAHTSYNSFYKWTKISSLEIDIFDLKMMGKVV